MADFQGFLMRKSPGVMGDSWDDRFFVYNDKLGLVEEHTDDVAGSLELGRYKVVQSFDIPDRPSSGRFSQLRQNRFDLVVTTADESMPWRSNVLSLSAASPAEKRKWLDVVGGGSGQPSVAGGKQQQQMRSDDTLRLSRYMVVGRQGIKIRAGFDLDSQEIGTLDLGVKFASLERRVDKATGVARLRLATGGWTSENSKSDPTQLVAQRLRESENGSALHQLVTNLSADERRTLAGFLDLHASQPSGSTGAGCPPKRTAIRRANWTSYQCCCCAMCAVLIAALSFAAGLRSAAAAASAQ
jgi:hypothetical protein